MSIYENDYDEEFINELPVDFYRIKNMDLSLIPEHFRALFRTDWNWGRHSTMEVENRMFLEELFHDYNRWDIKRMKEANKVIEPPIPFAGFDRL